MDVVDPKGKRVCIPEVLAPLRLECSSRGWWTMLGWEGANPNEGVDVGGGAKVDVASCVLITMVFCSIRS